jgi:SAM-dependent methyltransferase
MILLSMHNSSFQKMKIFSDVYLSGFEDTILNIMDFGSQSIDGDPLIFRNIFSTSSWIYTGVDIVSGPNVDVVLSNPYAWDEIESDSMDIVISGQAFEHIEYFWVTMFEIGRILKPGGVAVIIAPSNGFEHRYPVDCWRFYRDGFAALSRMIDFRLIESFTDWDRTGDDIWCDTIGVFQKPHWDSSSRSYFLEKCEGAYKTLPKELQLPRNLQSNRLVVESALSSLQGLQISDLLEEIRISSVEKDQSLRIRFRMGVKVIIGRKGVRMLRKLFKTPVQQTPNNWGTNKEVLSDIN